MYISYERDKLYFESQLYGKEGIQLDSPIEKIKTNYDTIFIKCKEDNYILLEAGKSNMKLVHEYSHLIPTWMKEEFNNFLEVNIGGR